MDSSAPDQVSLPIEAALPALRKALSTGHVVLSAPPGSGKTTRIPLALLEEDWLQGKSILMLEPRRPAARMAARFMAALLEEDVGQSVGYQVRFERVLGPSTRVEVITEGILTRRLQTDPELSGVGLLIFDEFHERSLQADLGLALSIDVCEALREDLRLLVMSATLDTGPLEALLPAIAINAAGRQYPVDIHYTDRTGPDAALLRPEQYLPQVHTQVLRALQEQVGDVLVFLPGRREIERMLEWLSSDAGAADCEVLPLFGELSAQAQDRVLRPDARAPRRIILSTDLAESSLTIARIGVVVDSGLARKPAFDPNSGLTRLKTHRIARDSATQRAGRAGRLGPGACYRVWTEAQHARLAETTPAEILGADLAPLVLELAQWGVNDREALRWLSPPPLGAWRQAWDLLHDLDALDAAGAITPVGRKMAGMPLHPRLAHMLVVAAEAGQGELATDLAALISERDPMRAHRGERYGSVPKARDIGLRLDALRDWRERGVCATGFDKQALRNIDRVVGQLRRGLPSAGKATDHISAGGLLSLAYPDRIAQRRPGTNGRFLMASGRAVRLPESDALARSDYVVVLDLDGGGREASAWLASVCALDEILQLHRRRAHSEHRLSWDQGREAVTARLELSLDAMIISSETTAIEDTQRAVALLLQRVRAKGLSCLHWSAKADQFRARVETLRALQADAAWPDLSDAGLLAGLEQWLTPWLSGVYSLKDLRKVDLYQALLAALDWPQQQALDRLAPERFRTPGGSERRIEYSLDGPPVLAAPLQEMFGSLRGPAVADGQLNVLLHLLSPAGRPLQITQDLEHFWLGGYKEVRKEMRGRYPKHNWPLDPVTEIPHRGVKRRPSR